MSLKGDKYETAEEIRARLEGTVVRYDNEPVYITRVEEDDRDDIARVYFRKLPYSDRGEEYRKYLSSRYFNCSPFQMGYVNYQGKAVLLSRLPARQYKQGLSGNSLMVTDIQGKDARRGFGGIVEKGVLPSFNDLLRSSVFPDLIAKKYPSFKEVGELLADDVKSVALSPSYAVAIDRELESLFLFNKGTRVGLALIGDKGIRLSSKFHYLKEELEEHRVPLAA